MLEMIMAIIFLMVLVGIVIGTLAFLIRPSKWDTEFEKEMRERMTAKYGKDWDK